MAQEQEVFNTPGEHTFSAPYAQTITVEVWGAGGGDGGTSNTTGDGVGGDGGYIEFTYGIGESETLTVLVGEGGEDGVDGSSGGTLGLGDGGDGSAASFPAGGGGAGSAVEIETGQAIGWALGGGGGGAGDFNNFGGDGGGGGAYGGTGGTGYGDGVDGEDASTDPAGLTSAGGDGGDGRQTDGTNATDGGPGGTYNSSGLGNVQTATPGGGASGDGQVTITYETPDEINVPVTEWTLATPEPDVSGSGTVTADVPATEWTLATVAPAVEEKRIVNVPTTEWELSTAEPSVAGEGTATVDLPVASAWELATVVPTVGTESWTVDGLAAGVETGETSTHRALTLSLRAETDTLTSVLRPLKTDEGKVDVLPTDDGGFVSVDRADGDNTYRVVPPISRQPLRQSGDFHVRRYEEDLVSQTVEEWDVELELVRDANRADSPSVSESKTLDGAAFPWTFDQEFTGRSQGEWALQTRRGTLVTDRVDAEVLGRGDGGVERFELTARLTFAQAHAFEAALALVEGTRLKEVPDGANSPVDETQSDTATLTVDVPPGQSAITDGEYVVLEWSSRRLSGAFQEVEFVIAPV